MSKSQIIFNVEVRERTGTGGARLLPHLAGCGRPDPHAKGLRRIVRDGDQRRSTAPRYSDTQIL